VAARLIGDFAVDTEDARTRNHRGHARRRGVPSAADRWAAPDQFLPVLLARRRLREGGRRRSTPCTASSRRT